MASLGVAAGASGPQRPLEVRLWVTDAASAYPDVLPRAGAYLRTALHAAGFEVDVSYGERPQSFAASDDRYVRRVGWPERVLEGVAGLGSVHPARDVNLLLTDGSVFGATAGYGMRRIAAVAGARYLADMAPADRTPAVVPDTVPAAVVQLLLHECGHALGLHHADGSVNVTGHDAVVSPMLGGYAWADAAVRRRAIGGDTNACGAAIPTLTTQRRWLSLRYSGCATAALQRHHDDR